jgi:hypothetical protein
MGTASRIAPRHADRARRNATQAISTWESHALMFWTLWIVLSLVVALEAKFRRRDPGVWFLVSIVASPLLGGITLVMADQRGWFRK